MITVTLVDNHHVLVWRLINGVVAVVGCRAVGILSHRSSVGIMSKTLPKTILFFLCDHELLNKSCLKSENITYQTAEHFWQWFIKITWHSKKYDGDRRTWLILCPSVTHKPGSHWDKFDPRSKVSYYLLSKTPLDLHFIFMGLKIHFSLNSDFPHFLHANVLTPVNIRCIQTKIDHVCYTFKLTLTSILGSNCNVTVNFGSLIRSNSSNRKAASPIKLSFICQKRKIKMIETADNHKGIH